MTPSPPPRSSSRRTVLGAGIALLLLGSALYVALRQDPTAEDDSAQAQARPPTFAARPSAPAAQPGGAPKDDDDPGEVAVRVMDPDHQPVVGARVQLIPIDEAHGASGPPCPCGANPRGEGERLAILDEGCGICAESTELLLSGGNRGGGFLAEREARTDASGTVRFPAQGSVDHAVWIEAPGFRALTVVAEVADPGDDAQEVALERPRSLQVRVEDQEGRPIAEATLGAYCALPFLPLGPLRHGAEHTLDDLPSGGEVHLLAQAPGFLPAQVATTGDADEPLVLVLRRPLRLSGRVLHGDQPVAGATIQLTSDSVHDLAVTSDRDGRFVFTGAGEGSVTLTGDKGRLHGTLTFDLAEEGPEVALLLVEAAQVSGTVTDARTGTPLAGAEVELRGEDDGFASAQTQDDGRYSLPLGPGTFTLRVADERHLSASIALRVAEGQQVVQDVALQAGNALSGRVVDGRGAPIAGASVHVEVADNREVEGTAHTATTDGEGRFALQGLSDGPQVIVASAADHPELSQPLSLPSREVTLTMRDGTVIEGEVQGPQGPLSSARVEVAPAADVRGGAVASAQTDDRGHFRVGGLTAGAATVVALAEGLAPSDPVSLEVQDGQTARVQITLQPGLEIRGKVVDDQGAPIGEAMIEGYADTTTRAPLPGRNASATSGADGSFVLRGLHAGTYFVYGYRDGLSQSAPLPIAAGSRALTLTLSRGARIAGRVVSRSGAPVRRFTVEGQDFRTPDGAFLLKDVASESAEIFVEGPFPTRRVPVKLRAGETTSVGDIVVDDGEELRGLVRSPEGRPAPGVQVTALPPGLDPSGGEPSPDDEPLLDSPRTITTDAEGRFAFPHLRPGTYLVQASSPSAASAPLHASSKGGEVVLDLLPGATLHGRATLADGTPVPEGVAIYVAGALTAQARVVEGVFELSGLPAGEGQLMVTGGSRASRATGNQTLRLTAGEVRALTLALRPSGRDGSPSPPRTGEANPVAP